MARQYGKISREEIERRLAEMKSAGKESSPEFMMFQRMRAAQDRLDAGTAAHTTHARTAAAGAQASSMSWALILIAVGLAGAAIFLLFR